MWCRRGIGINGVMSTALHRLGRFAARRPWTVIGVWVALAVTVIGSATMFGRDLEDSMRVPGLDSQAAVDLLTAAGSDRAGLTARVVVTPSDGDSFFVSSSAQAALADLQSAVGALPQVIATSDTAAAASGRGWRRTVWCRPMVGSRW